MVEQLRPRIQSIADELLDAVEARREMDLSAEYAFPLPITVIAELLGVPTERPGPVQSVVRRDHHPGHRPGAGSTSSRRWATSSRTWPSFFAARRAEPRDDLVSALLTARDEEDALTEEEVFGTV